MYYYSLRISISDKGQIDQLNRILEIESNYPEVGWGIEIIKENSNIDFNFADYFLSILNGKEAELKAVNISTDNISIWVLYEYEGQCNLEFTPTDLKRFGDAGISLCISCWEKQQ